MKLLITACLLALLCLSFNRTKQLIPPGTVQVNDTLFADETEISNSAWMEYEMSVKQKYGSNSAEHIATLPDTLCWKEKLSYNEPYVQYYYRHPAYRNFPVVGVSYEQALAFCAWRTEKVNLLLSLKKNFKHQNFNYRLPTKTEWEKMAEPSSEFLINDGKTKKGIPLLNCRNLVESKPGISPYPDVTAPVISYAPNAFKLYNALGNVAEMISEKGICKGGGWRNTPEECRVGKDMAYEKPNAWLGFRCVCIVK